MQTNESMENYLEAILMLGKKTSGSSFRRYCGAYELQKTQRKRRYEAPSRKELYRSVRFRLYYFNPLWKRNCGNDL